MNNNAFGNIIHEYAILKHPNYKFHISDFYYDYYLNHYDSLLSSNSLNYNAQNMWKHIIEDSFKKPNFYSTISSVYLFLSLPLHKPNKSIKFIGSPLQ